AMALTLLPVSAFALNGTVNYTPAESCISGKYWVTFSSDEGDAALASDGDETTAWVWENEPAELTVDLGGAYDAIRKIETVFADSASRYQYKIEGSADGEEWETIADKSANTTPGAVFTDIFTFEGLRYVKLTVLSSYVPGVKEFRIINYLRPDMNNGSDSSTVSYSYKYNYNANNNPPVEGYRGGSLNDEGSAESGNNYFGLVKDLGWDTTRLRVWNEPRSEGDWRYAGDINEAIGANWPSVSTSATSCAPSAQLNYAKYIVGAGQKLAIDFHYADSWADPQNQPKPYAWAELPFDELVDTVYDFTYDYLKQLIEQGTPPSIVALGNEITNGMMWGSEYLEVNEYADYHDYYKRFIRDNSPENMQEDGRTIDGTLINPDATPGGGVKWVKYAEADGDTESAAYQEFLASINNLARLVDAGNRAILKLNEEYKLDIQSEMHFAFNVIEQPRNGDKVVLDEDYVFNKVMTLISNLAEDLNGMSGMVDRIGVSYYPDWHGTYATVQKNIVEMSKILPGVQFNIAECSPSHSGTISSELDNPNYPVGTRYSTQMAGDIAIEIMKTINDVPGNVGQGVWPWNGQSVYGVSGGGCGSTAYTLQASMLAWNDAFAKNVVESSISVPAETGKEIALPETVKSLDVATGEITDVPVVWDEIPEDAEGTFTVKGRAQVEVPAEGRGKAMTEVTAYVTEFDAIPKGALVGTKTVGKCGEGETATVEIKYVGDADIGSLVFKLESDLPIKSVKLRDEYAGTMIISQYNPETGEAVIMDILAMSIGQGTIATVVIDLDADPWYPEGDYPINITAIDAMTFNMFTIDYDTIPVGTYPAVVTIENDYPAGDVSQDGAVDNRDLILIARYLVHLVEFNEKQKIAADFNEDGIINNSDLVQIARYVVSQS
ncbi:MAG: glycosyl hydrolase 53 family protein, partial [Oscillospiraceae bacterium]|nr:glycosyl hydrolase 53 family protein [Oscillospiraceae bacterium]